MAFTAPVVALFVPGDRPDRFARAAAVGDVTILDLEDAVGAERKDLARERVRDAMRAGVIAWVRINPPLGDLGRADLAALADRPPRAIVVPKAGSAADIAAVRRVADVPIVALVESIAGMRDIEAIAHGGVAALAFGGFDLCAELGARPTPETIAPWRSRVVFAAREAGIAALDTPYVRLDDREGLARDAARAVDFGFDGKLAVHPDQAAVIRAAFAPSETEIAWARGVVRAAESGGAQRFEGMMIDEPLVRGARAHPRARDARQTVSAVYERSSASAPGRTATRTSLSADSTPASALGRR